MHNKDNMTIFLADYSPVVEACKSLEGMREWFSSGQNI
jgi:hypothetical protein